MTKPELEALVKSYSLTVPVTVDDCRELYNDIKPRLPVGTALDVMLVQTERTAMDVLQRRLPDARALRIVVGRPPTHDSFTINAS